MMKTDGVFQTLETRKFGDWTVDLSKIRCPFLIYSTDENYPITNFDAANSTIFSKLLSRDIYRIPKVGPLGLFILHYKEAFEKLIKKSMENISDTAAANVSY